MPHGRASPAPLPGVVLISVVLDNQPWGLGPETPSKDLPRGVTPPHVHPLIPAPSSKNPPKVNVGPGPQGLVPASSSHELAWMCRLQFSKGFPLYLI